MGVFLERIGWRAILVDAASTPSARIRREVQ